MTTEENKLRAKLRTAVADYMRSEGCDCCQGLKHYEHKDALCKLLKMKKYDDGSGYDYSLYLTKEKK